MKIKISIIILLMSFTTACGFKVANKSKLLNFKILKIETSGDDRVNYLKVLTVFTLGSMTGLITLSKLLGYLLTKFNQLCNSIIFGFVIGSLGVIWPWKSVFNYKNEQQIIRYIPEMNIETIYAILYVLIGITTV